MKKKPANQKGIGRRKFLPFLGSGILLSLLPARVRAASDEPEQEYKTLLKPDGTAPATPP